MPVKIKRADHKKGTQGYGEFIDSLETACNLRDIDPGDLKWVDIVPSEISQPKIRVHIAEDHPDLSVILRPVNQSEQQITFSSEEYGTPLLLAAVNRWGQTDLALRNYKIDRFRGRSGKDTMFSQSRSLAEIVAVGHADTIKDSTPVVEVISLLPMAENGEFTTQFTPYFSFEVLGHRHYGISTICQNSLSAYALLSQGSNIAVKDIDEKQTMYDWKAQSFPSLSEIEKQMEPSSHGHMVLIATPVEPPERPKFDLGDYGFRDGLKSMGPQTFGGGNLMRGASISSASISRGSESGKAGLVEEEISASNEGNSIIYHIQFLCVTPVDAKKLQSAGLGVMGKSVHNYEMN